MIENFPVKIDNTGRIVIPKRVREKYDINVGTILSIIDNDDSLILKKVSNMEKNIIVKLEQIEKIYPNIRLLLTDNEKVIYKSNSIKTNNVNYLNISTNFIASENLQLKLSCFYEDEEEKKLAQLILSLLTK